MKKISIASVTLLVFRNLKIFVMVDSYNHVCKFHVDYDEELSDESKTEITDKVTEFASSLCPADLFGLVVSETSKDEVFKYLPSKFC